MARPRFLNLDETTRRRILETAASEFAARGFDGTSLNRLIDRLGLSKGSFYYYFDDKVDLFSTVADHAWTTFLPTDGLDLSGLDADTYWPALGELLRDAHATARANPWLVGFTRMIYDPPDVPEIRRALAERFAELRDLQTELIRRGQSLGVVRDDLPVELLQTLLVGADEATDRWFVEHWDRFPEDEIERLFQEVLAIFRRMMEPPHRREDAP
ncbi:MAG: TetR/AcrR family transcriptional regulator [Holophagae bacterium]